MIEMPGFDIEQMKMLGLVTLAMLLGGLIGWDREKAHKPAGIKTHMFVAGSSAIFVFLGRLLTHAYHGDLQQGAVRADPVQVIQAVVLGVSFLAAGTIVQRDEHKVIGLTTSATLLVSAAVGLCVALAQILLALGMTILTVGSLQTGSFLTKNK